MAETDAPRTDADATAEPAPGSSPDPASGAAQEALPLFYNRVEVLDAARHGDLGLAAHDGYAFAAEANAVPVNLTEFARAAVCYPIVFTGVDRLSPAVVTGLRRGQNLFVGDDGAWRPDAYIPAYARRHPFILTRSAQGGDQVLLCIDRSSPRLVEGGGDPLFENGEAARPATAALDFCLTFQRQAMASLEAVKALQEAGLLSLQEGKVEMKSGETLRLTDFHVVDEKKLNALPDDRLAELRRKGALAAAYCQMVSMNCWPKLANLAETAKA